MNHLHHPRLPLSRLLLPRPDSIERSPSTANCSDSTSREDDGSVSTNFVGNTLTQSEAIETYRPYDVTSSRRRKMKIAVFANFGGIEKLFCVPDQSLKCS